MSDLLPAMPARVFVGVKIDSEVARELVRIAAAIERPSVRLVAADDIHLTLVPPWREADCARAATKLRDVAGRFHSFELTLQHVGFGPDPKRPHLLWVDCAPTVELSALRTALLQCLGQEDPRPFWPHVTLARLRGSGAMQARKHRLDPDVRLLQTVRAIALFKSPDPPERGYRIVASAQMLAAPELAAAGQSRPVSNSSHE